jgi:hypothetical protein
MPARRHLIATLLSLPLLLQTAGAAAGDAAQAGEWVSYRDAYRSMVRFEKYGGPKNLLQNTLQVVPKDRAPLGDGAQLLLAGKTVQVNLPLDALGRTVFPLQKAAYDENAALVLNRKGTAFTVRPQVAIAPRPDGQYDAAELRAACAQAQAYARYVDASQGARACAGVRFVFAKKGEALVRVRRADGPDSQVAAGEGEEGLAGATYRFGAAADRAQVVTANAPLAILPVIE